MQAKEVMDVRHPLHKMFVRFCGNNPQTKRQARKFLAWLKQKHPSYLKAA